MSTGQVETDLSLAVAERHARSRGSAPRTIEAASSAALPKLGWIATLHIDAGRLEVLHGRAVECRSDWLVEGVWDGRFEEGGFHEGRHLFGSGIRVDGDAVRFVPSCALVDRLVCCRDGGKLLVSNSLVLLVAATGCRLDQDHDYLQEAKAMLAGIEAYDTAFHVVHPSIPRFHQVYHAQIVVRDGAVTLERVIPVREFSGFEEYRGMLRDRLAAICGNAADPARKTPVAAFGTLSSGYDSTAVTALVRHLGVRRYFTYVGSWTEDTRGQPEYETAAIAAALDVETVPLEPDQAPTADDELLLRAASPLGYQVPLITMARRVDEEAEAAAVFTGFHGDIVWDVNVPDSFVSEGIIRHDVSGLDLAELRLKRGFFNVAVPFLYAASIKSIAAISRSPEMQPWRLRTEYDRPISRRIVEEAGVPRRLFGFLKGGIFGGSVRPANLELRARYFGYLHRNVLPLPLVYARAAADRYTWRMLGKASRFARRKLRSPRLHAAIMKQLFKFYEGYSWYGRRNFRGTFYAWAVSELAADAARSLDAHGIDARGLDGRALDGRALDARRRDAHGVDDADPPLVVRRR
jgi:hypothetical protein